MKLLVFGSVNIDAVYRVDHIAGEGETIDSLSYQTHEGGKGLNQSIALAKAGANVCFAGAVGHDGEYLLKYMASFGVNTERAFVVDESTGHTIIQVDRDGRNCIILFGGANRAVTTDMVDKALDGFGEGDGILMQNEISSVGYIMKAARGRGMRVFFNASPITPDINSLPLDQVSMFLINEVEGSCLTGCEYPDMILDAMLAKYPDSAVLLTLGGKGAVYSDGQRRIRQEAIPVSPVDTTGAGDTFTGYFLQSLMNADPIEAALLRAARAASIAVGRPGAGQSIPYSYEVDV
ncbi:MAG: ribokinase [Oscillospiraceae bacterium]|nr:ribokinase [Oscillospiraceae bacterium]